MRMGKIILIPVLIALFLPCAAESSPFLVGDFSDTYLHPRDGNPGERGLDVIGDLNFNLIKYRIWGDRSAPGWVQIDIQTQGITGDGTRVTDAALGDLLLDTRLNGNFDLAVALRAHQQSPFFTSMGIEDTEIEKGDVFVPDSYRLSDDYYNPAFWYFGDNEIVTAFGRIVGKANVLYDGAGNISVVFQQDGLDPENLRLHLAWTCGNEVMETTSQVPEASPLLLLGFGMFGLAVVRNRSLQKIRSTADISRTSLRPNKR